MIHNIADRDDDAMRMKACWKKMNNFLTSFAVDYFRLQKDFEDGKYGSDWPFRRWLLLKVAVSEENVLTVLKSRENALAAEEREERDRAADLLRREKHVIWREREAEKDAIRAEKQRKRDADAAEKQRKHDEAEAVKAQKAVEAAKADSGAAKKHKNQKQKQRDKNDPNRNDKWRHAIVMKRGTPELKAVTPELDATGKAIVIDGKLPLATCQKIADFPPDQQAVKIAESFANRHVRPHKGRKLPNTPIISLPDESPELVQLAIGIKAALDMAAQNDSVWINMMIDAAIKTATARRLHRDNIGFGEWWDAHKLGLNKNDRAALIAMGEHPNEMRKVLNESASRSLQLTYKKYEERFPSARKTPSTNGISDSSLEPTIPIHINSVAL